jgi:hypothetical protein
MTVRVKIVIEQNSGISTHELTGPGTLVLPVLAKVVKAAVGDHEHEFATIAELVHQLSAAWKAATE